MVKFKPLSARVSHASNGSIIHVGKQRLKQAKITFIEYDQKVFRQKEIKNVEECLVPRAKGMVTWINVDGLHQTEIVEKIGKHFGVHHLLLENIVNTTSRPKLDNFGDYLFIVMKQISSERKRLKVDQLSLVVGKNFVLTFQEQPDLIFDIVKKHLAQNRSHIRSLGADHLAYALIDAVVDDYFVTIEKVEEQMDDLEDLLINQPQPEAARMIDKLRKDAIFLRKSIWPLREIISSLERQDSALVKKETLVYLRDVYDHVVQIIDVIEMFRDLLSGMLDLYLSSLSNRMNEVMKTLTIIATIFIPLTFLAGVYGMNFKFMPELDSPWGYPAVWLVMIVSGLSMVAYFKRKKWF